MPEVFDATQKKPPRKLKTRSVGRRYHRVWEAFRSQANANPLATFAITPPATHFSTQEPEEKIILLLRQHPIVNIPWILMAVLLIFAPLVLDYIPVINFLPANFQIMILYLWYFMVMVFVSGQFLIWYFNIYIVTDERLVDIDFFGLSFHDVTVIKVDKIQAINYNRGGVWASFFDFGDVDIQSAGEISRCDFLKVPNPDKVVKIVGELINEEEAEATK